MIPLLVAVVSGLAVAQYGGGRGGGRRGGGEDSVPPASCRRIATACPNWKNDERFKHDVFTFVRVEYDSGRRIWVAAGAAADAGSGGGGGWMTDWPDSDLNFSFRLQQLTSLKVNPEPIMPPA